MTQNMDGENVSGDPPPGGQALTLAVLMVRPHLYSVFLLNVEIMSHAWKKNLFHECYHELKPTLSAHFHPRQEHPGPEAIPAPRDCSGYIFIHGLHLRLTHGYPLAYLWQATFEIICYPAGCQDYIRRPSQLIRCVLQRDHRYTPSLICKLNILVLRTEYWPLRQCLLILSS